MSSVSQFKVRTKISNPSCLLYPYPRNGGPESNHYFYNELKTIGKNLHHDQNFWTRHAYRWVLYVTSSVCPYVCMSVRVRHKFSYLPLPLIFLFFCIKLALLYTIWSAVYRFYKKKMWRPRFKPKVVTKVFRTHLTCLQIHAFCFYSTDFLFVLNHVADTDGIFSVYQFPIAGPRLDIWSAQLIMVYFPKNQLW